MRICTETTALPTRGGDQAAPVARVRRENLLIIDDEEAIGRSLIREFRREYHVFTAVCAEDGGQIMRSHEIQVVISDQRMPGQTGCDFFRAIL